MTSETQAKDAAATEAPKELTPAARRALAEAEARRRQREEPQLAPEVNGRGGAEPVRYGDWEVKGLATDF